MQLHRLEIEGFGPFRERQSIDFDAFADDGIFLIAGRTGAGKSSILDAVCFGLYGGVPRYEKGGEKRLRSDHSEPDEITEVVVEFSTVAGRFRVTRSPEYLRWSKDGAKDGDLVFVSGHPGSTNRLLTEAQLRFERDVRMPLMDDWLNTMAKAMREYGQGAEEP